MGDCEIWEPEPFVFCHTPKSSWCNFWWISSGRLWQWGLGVGARDEESWTLDLCVLLSDWVTWTIPYSKFLFLVYKMKNIAQLTSRVIFSFKILWSLEQAPWLEEHSVLYLNMSYSCIDYFWIFLPILIWRIPNWQEHHISTETNFKPMYVNLDPLEPRDCPGINNCFYSLKLGERLTEGIVIHFFQLYDFTKIYYFSSFVQNTPVLPSGVMVPFTYSLILMKQNFVLVNKILMIPFFFSEAVLWKSLTSIIEVSFCKVKVKTLSAVTFHTAFGK